MSRLNRPQWYWPLALLLALFYVGTSLYISAHRLLWYDEIFTAIYSRQPSMRDVWNSLAEGTQQIPPLYFFITLAVDRLFHHADFALRIPSILGLAAGVLVIFDIVRRLTDGIYGLIAMSLLTTSYVMYYGYEARPYSLYFLWASIAIWLWTFTPDESKPAAIAFGLLFAVGVFTHYYFVLCLGPFAIYALMERRPMHPKLIASTIGVAASLAVLYPLVAGSHYGSAAGTWAPPKLSSLQSVYFEFFPETILPVLLVGLCTLAFGRFREKEVLAMSPAERISWLFLSVPLGAFILAIMINGIFHRRYVIGALPGLVIGIACFLWRQHRESARLSLALLLVVAGFGAAQQALTMRHAAHIRAIDWDNQEDMRQLVSLEDTLSREGKTVCAVAHVGLFLESWYYSKHPERYAGVSQPWPIKKYAPTLQFMSVEDIVAKARETALVWPTPGLIDELQRLGVRVKVRFPEQYVYYIE